MKFNYKLLLVLPILFLLVGCPKDDPAGEEIRPFSDVYAEDIAEIEQFMDTHKMNVDANYNVTFEEITSTNPGTPISDRSDLEFKIINQNDIAYKLYYIKLREGVGERPTRLDSVYTSYKGHKTNLTSFDSAPNPVWFELEDLIQGWREIMPEFKIGTYVANGDGTFTFNDFGAGVMFIPSGLAYFNASAGTVEAYTPIIFNFKLMNLRYKDHDADKILSKDEYGPNYPSSYLDSDGDGVKDYLDIDDDNDGVLTKVELATTSATLITGVNSSHYVYSTIPVCPGSTNGKPIHLNPACQND